MTINNTYLTLRRQIADELGDRQDLLSPLGDSALTKSPIVNAIESAIAKWERVPFYFVESYTSPLFTTVSGQEFYTTSDAAAIATAPSIYDMHALISGNRYQLYKRTWDYIEGVSVNPSVTGFPTNWAYFAEQIRLYPIPDGAYPIRASLDARFTALANDSDTNVWTQDAYDLIRSEAKLILAVEVLSDDDLAARMTMSIYGAQGTTGYLGALRAETNRRNRSRVRPSYF